MIQMAKLSKSEISALTRKPSVVDRFSAKDEREAALVMATEEAADISTVTGASRGWFWSVARTSANGPSEEVFEDEFCRWYDDGNCERADVYARLVTMGFTPEEAERRCS